MRPATRNPWIVKTFPNPQARLRLLCLPYAGGGASVFFPWGQRWRHLPVEVCSVRLPGRENRFREPPVQELEPVVDALVAELEAMSDVPFSLFGHSLGALVGFELIRALRRSGLRLPDRFFASAAFAPDWIGRDNYPYELPAAEFLELVARRYRGLPDEVLAQPELLELVLPALRADFALMAHYRFREEPPLPCALYAWGGTEDARVAPAALEGWRKHTSAAFSTHRFPGGHFYVQQSEAGVVGKLARELQLS